MGPRAAAAKQNKQWPMPLSAITAKRQPPIALTSYVFNVIDFTFIFGMVTFGDCVHE